MVHHYTPSSSQRVPYLVVDVEVEAVLLPQQVPVVTLTVLLTARLTQRPRPVRQRRLQGEEG